MLKCWDSDPEDRPSFTKIGSTISKALQTMEGYLYVCCWHSQSTSHKYGTGQLVLVNVNVNVNLGVDPSDPPEFLKEEEDWRSLKMQLVLIQC